MTSAITDTVRLTRAGRNPRDVITIDHHVAEVVLLYGLTHVGYLLNRGTRITGQREPGLILAPCGPERVLDTASLRLYLALHRRLSHGAL